MPQFDQGSFLNQVFWFFLIFINSYFLITYFFLPIICENLKFRKKKIIKNKINQTDIKLENLQQNLFLNNTFQQLFNHLNFSLNTISSQTVLSIKPLKNQTFLNLKLKENLKTLYINLFAYPKKF